MRPTNTQHALPPVSNIDNLLVGLTWFGEISTEQIHRLWFAAKSARWARYELTEMRRQGYITLRRWGTVLVKGQPPRQQKGMWSITTKGRERLEREGAFPPNYLAPRARRTLDHDHASTEFLTRMVELARERKRFCGLYLEREVRLDPHRTKPITDSVAILTFGEAYPHTNRIPWSNDPALPSETRVRYALENDRGTEPLHVLREKAYTYKKTFENPIWTKTYGAFPIPIILVPGETRLDNILDHWRDAWPNGKWLMTTDAWMHGDQVLEYDRGMQRRRGLFRTRPTPPP